MRKSDNIKTQEGKRKFIKDLCNSVRDSLLKKVPELPEDWDGHELRWLIAKVFEDQTSKLPLGRKRAMLNEILVRNLDR